MKSTLPSQGAAFAFSKGRFMSRPNVGTVDRVPRILTGLAPIGLAATGKSGIGRTSASSRP
jgi:hypothetical protein